MKLVIATKNIGKLAEFKSLLADLPFTICSLSDYPYIGDIAETGETFHENAALKAEVVAKLTGQWTLADDSGLEVEALNGRPGVFSARFAGENADDQTNNAKLLRELEAVPDEARTARFRAVIALAHMQHQTRFAEGACKGLITRQQHGSGGFGYDPLFYYPPVGRTFAEMTSQEKNKISHRANALNAAYDILKQIAETVC